MSPARFPAFSSYIGVPYVDHGRGPAGWDCYGLVYYLNNFVLGRAVPSYFDSYPSARDDDHVISAIAYHCREWIEVDREQMEAGDTLVFNLAGVPIHCGLVCDESRMIHCMAGHETVIESFQSFAWNKRLVGIFRWN